MTKSIESYLAEVLLETNDIAERVFTLFPLRDLISLASCSKLLRSSFHARLAVQGFRSIEHRLDCDPQDLQEVLVNTYALITGNTCLEVLGLIGTDKRSTTDMLVPLDNVGDLEKFLVGRGFKRAHSSYESVASATVYLYQHRRLPSVSITAAPSDKFWLAFLRFRGTMSALFMSATSVFVLYPELTFERMNLMRNTSVHLVSEHDNYHVEASRLGFCSFRHNGFDEPADALRSCPGPIRILRGANGIAALPWAELPYKLSQYQDYFRSAYKRGFSDNFFSCGWQFATCSDDWCDYRRLMSVPGLDGPLV
ncbi:hypothetical protein AAF712_014890 [Marasmius tenuissimus]|uniref:F-box domain-containing protein n=1 Tax=Marasmius tenuissimus TaxID=585030 RepID=A0ABR2ZB14_9AGAR